MLPTLITVLPFHKYPNKTWIITVWIVHQISTFFFFFQAMQSWIPLFLVFFISNNCLDIINLNLSMKYDLVLHIDSIDLVFHKWTLQWQIWINQLEGGPTWTPIDILMDQSSNVHTLLFSFSNFTLIFKIHLWLCFHSHSFFSTRGYGIYTFLSTWIRLDLRIYTKSIKLKQLAQSPTNK